MISDGEEKKASPETAPGEESSFVPATAEEIARIPGRILGVDFGDVRTGLAVSDVSRYLASGIGTVKPGGIAATVAAVAAAALERGVTAAVVGLPVNMDGTEGRRAGRCREFARMLTEKAGIPVMMCDERLSTVAASRYLNETDTRGRARKKVIDALSAELILQSALDRIRNLNR